jgi:ankyrin repeat protein
METDTCNQHYSHIFKLPNEIILLIGEYLSISSLNSFVQTARWVNRILTHHLYTLALSHISKDGKSVLDWAVRKGRMATAKRILKCSPPDYLRKALSFASSTGCEDVVRFLLASSAYTYSQKPIVENNSPLMAAYAGGHIRIVQLLLESGENVNTRNSCYYTPLHLAAREGHMNVVQLLLDYGAKLIAARGMRTPLDDAVLGGNPEIVQLFLDLGPNTKVRGYPRFRGPTSRQRMYMPLFSERSLSELLHFAITSSRRGNVQVARLLIEHGANAQHVNSDGATPLHHAAQATWEPSRQMEMVQLLIKCGASIHATNYDGDTPLHRAAGQGAIRQVIQGLIECGADINASNDPGETPLHLAARGGEIEAAKALIDCGADITATNSQGETAFRVAVSERQKEIVELLSD